jgi:hypothetical protein
MLIHWRCGSVGRGGETQCQQQGEKIQTFLKRHETPNAGIGEGGAAGRSGCSFRVRQSIPYATRSASNHDKLIQTLEAAVSWCPFGDDVMFNQRLFFTV